MPFCRDNRFISAKSCAIKDKYLKSADETSSADFSEKLIEPA